MSLDGGTFAPSNASSSEYTMARQSLYEGLPEFLQHLATAGFGLQAHIHRMGGIYSATRRSLGESEWWSADQLEAMQIARLQALVEYATEHTPYWRSLFAYAGVSHHTIRDLSDLRRLPLLEKVTLLRNGNQMIVTGVPHTRTYYTSGTSGTTLAVPIDDGSRQRNYAFFARARAWAGVETGRSATFAGRAVVPAHLENPARVWRWNPAMRNRLFSSYHLSARNAASYSRALCEWAPDTSTRIRRRLRH